MKISKPKNLLQKDLIVFDLDGTLVLTKSKMDKEMVGLMGKLMATKKVAVIGGGKYEVFQELMVKQLTYHKEFFKNLYLFPATATAFYKFQKKWERIYSISLSKKDKARIKKSFKEVLEEIKYRPPNKVYGKVFEDRVGEEVYSFLGQDVVKRLGRKGVTLKTIWKKEHTPLKLKVARLVAKKLPGLEVRAAGYSSIDVTKKGIDKAFGIKQMTKYLKVPVKKMLFVGDAIFPGGNDYAALKTGVDYVSVKDPEETKKLIRWLLKNSLIVDKNIKNR